MTEVQEGAIQGLRDAEDLMNHGGLHWVQGTFEYVFSDTGEVLYCLIGGVSKSLTGEARPLGRVMPEAYAVAIRALAKAIVGDKMESRAAVPLSTLELLVMDWNDKDGRKWGGVKRVIRKAIRLIEAGEVR